MSCKVLLLFLPMAIGSNVVEISKDIEKFSDIIVSESVNLYRVSEQKSIISQFLDKSVSEFKSKIEDHPEIVEIKSGELSGHHVRWSKGTAKDLVYNCLRVSFWVINRAYT